MKETAKKIFSISLRVGISVFILIFLFEQVDKKALLGIISNSHKKELVLAFFVFFLAYVLAVLRWEMLLKAVKIQLPFKRVIISFAGGTFFSLFLPSTIGGDLMRTIDLAQHTKKPREVVATVLLDRLSGYTGLVILALFALFLGWDLIKAKTVFFCVALITFILVSILLVLFNKKAYNIINRLLDSPNSGKIREMIRDLHAEIHLFRQHKNVILGNILVSIAIQACVPVTFCIIAGSLGVKIPIVYFFIFVPIIGAITLLPISLGGLGLRDATTIFFFAMAGIPKDTAFAMSLINFFYILICGALGGLIYVLTVRNRRLQYHKPSQLHSVSK